MVYAEDLVQATSGSAGTGDIVLAQAIDALHFMPSAALDGLPATWMIRHQNLDEIEVIHAVYQHTPTPTILRGAATNGAVSQSTAGGNKVTFSPGGLLVALVMGAEDHWRLTLEQLVDAGTMAGYSAGAQVTPGDADVVYSRAVHGDFPAFWYRDPPLSVGRYLRFPITEGVTGSLCMIRVRSEAVNELTVELESADAPGTYVQLPIPAGHTRVVRKQVTAGWWTDFGFWQNGAQVNHEFVNQGDAEAGTLTAARSWSPERVRQAIEALALQSADLLAPDQGAAGFTATVKHWKGTAAEYDALAVKDPNTVYYVIP